MSGVGQHRGRGVTESPGSDNSEATGSVQDGHAQENPAAGPQQKTKRKMMKKKRGRVTSGTPSLTSETDIQALHGTMLEVNAHLAEIKHQMRRGSERYAFASDVVRKPHAEEVGDETQVETRTVYTRFNVINLHDVTAVSVNVRLYYELLWELPVEQQNTKSHGPLDPPSDWTKEWQPQVGMDNITGEVLTVREWLGVEMHVGRRMAFKRWIGEGTFQQTFDFSEFPFDSTEFKITLRSHLTTREVKLVDNLALHDPTEKTRWLRGDSNVGSVLSVDKFQLSHYWRIDHLPEIRDTTHLGVEPGLKGARPRIQLVIQGKRKAQYYYYNSILIFMVIVSLSFSVFCMPVTQLSERLNIVMSLVLSAVAHKLLCAEQLPDLPYLTYLDGYVLGGVGLLCVLAIECIVCATLFDTVTAESIDTVCGWGLVVIWLAVNVYVYWLHQNHQSAAIGTPSTSSSEIAWNVRWDVMLAGVGCAPLWYCFYWGCMWGFTELENW
eukprot:m.61084 g.61084  ORF g.61084 m.61084 type:complete len:495 (-) comp17522_c0_seq1:30-1514(-)